MAEKLYRSRDNKIIEGVIGGITEYINERQGTEIDPTVSRLVFILILILTGFVPAIIGYLLALVVVPKRSEEKE